MYKGIARSLIGFAAVAAFSTPVCAGESNPIFGKADVKVHVPKQNKAVTGKGYYADLYGYYGNYYNNLAGAYGNYGSYYKNYNYYYTAYQYASYASTNYYNAYLYQYYGQ